MEEEKFKAVAHPSFTPTNDVRHVMYKFSSCIGVIVHTHMSWNQLLSLPIVIYIYSSMTKFVHTFIHDEDTVTTHLLYWSSHSRKCVCNTFSSGLQMLPWNHGNISLVKHFCGSKWKPFNQLYYQLN